MVNAINKILHMDRYRMKLNYDKIVSQTLIIIFDGVDVEIRMINSSLVTSQSLHII